MSDYIEREPEEQIRFANMLEEFKEAVTRYCTQAIRGVEESKNLIQADNARNAMDYVEDLLVEIIQILDGIDEFAIGQKKRGAIIKEAEDYVFKK